MRTGSGSHQAQGGSLPDLPEFRDAWDGVALPLLLIGFNLAVALSPLILYGRHAGWDQADPLVWLCVVGQYAYSRCHHGDHRDTIDFPGPNPVNLFRI